MKLTFLGTRGNIAPESARHRMHTATMVSYGGRGVLIDCGETWRGRVIDPRPRAIVLTHAHEDHSGGLRDGAPCPVHATAETWERIGRFPIESRSLIAPRRPERIAGISFEAFPVVHSDRAPAVGYRVTAGRVTVFYVPDVLDLPDRDAALGGCRAYVGDGASVVRPIVRRSTLGGRLVGHTSVRTQIGWCRDAGVPLFLVTHCGSQIVRADPDAVARRVRALGREQGVDVEIAWDGMERVLR